MTARAGTEAEAAIGALDLVGEPAIASLDAGTAAARAVRAAFGDVRDAVLALHDWNFATAWSRPALAAGEAEGPLKKRYPLPADCISVRYVDGLEANEWAVEGAPIVDGGGATIEAKILVANIDNPAVCYTRRVETVALWDPLFLKVFHHYLAARIGPKIGRDATIGPALEAEGRSFLPTAKRRDSREGSRQTISRNTSWTRARRGWR